MKHKINIITRVAGLAALLATPAFGQQAFVKNPSFESNLNTNSAPLSTGAPMGWPYYSPIDDWVSAGGGVNDIVYDPGGPFHNAGTPVPDGRRVGFKQGSGAVSQDISGLTPGKPYWIQFRYDARNGSDLDLAIRFSTVNFGGSMDGVLDTIYTPKPASGGAPYYSRTVPFTPDVDSGTLSFEVTARGDSTILLDAVTIVQRDDGNFAVMNPSFEASGVVFDGASSAGQDWPAISGWAKTGVAGVDDGTGGRANNGAVPDQALVAFIAGQGSLTQTLDPVVANDTYQLQFAYNAASGTTPHLQVLADGAVVWESDVTAVGGTNPYKTQSVSFKATSDVAQISFSNTVAAATVLLDDVKVLGKTGTRLPPMSMAPAKVLLRIGGEATGSLSIPIERLALGPAVVKLASADTNVFVLPDADATGVLSLTFQTTNTLSFRVRAVGVGGRLVNLTDTAGLLPPATATTVFVAGGTFVMNPSFELDPDSGVANTPISNWTTSGGNIGVAQGGASPFLAPEDLTVPDRQKVLRMQAGGTVSQMINGLKPGQLYGLQFFYNGRNSGYPYEMAFHVSFDGKELFSDPAVMPAGQNGLTDYYFKEVRFTPANSSGLLEFKSVVTSGDATLFLDGISIIPRLANEIAVMNSSFEASAMGANWPGYLQNDRVAGWTCGGGGYGVNAYSPKTFFVEPFFDNGINSDQDNAFFGQNAVTISQTVTGLTAGQNYTLVFDYNWRDGRGQNATNTPNLGQFEVSLDGAVIKTSDELPPVDTITPWPGFLHTKPFYQAFIPITPAGDSTQLQIAHVNLNGLDKTLLIDNVRIVPGAHNPPSITKQLADQSVAADATVTFGVTASGTGLSYRWFQDGVPLSDGGSISGASTATLTITKAKVADSGAYSVIASDGLGMVGSVAQLTVQGPVSGDVTLTASVKAGQIEIAWPASATGYVLQSSAQVNTGWADDSAAAVQQGDQWVASLPTSGAGKFFRLIKR